MLVLCQLWQICLHQWKGHINKAREKMAGMNSFFLFVSHLKSVGEKWKVVVVVVVVLVVVIVAAAAAAAVNVS